MRLIFLTFAIAYLGLWGRVLAADISGYAWSSTIGWLSFSGPFYAASINDTTGNFSGYAWSENVGWVKLNPTGPYPALPFHGAKLDLNTGEVAGWMRTVAEDIDWDGWIKLSSSQDDKDDSWGVRQVGTADSGCYLTGYAWGSTVVGWLRFSGNSGPLRYQVRVTPCLVEGVEEPPIAKDLSCTFSAFPRRLVSPQRTSRLTWSCVDADDCSIAGFGPVNNVNGALTVIPPVTTTYILNCNNDQSQSISMLTTVTVIRSRICEIIPYFPGCPR